MIRYLRTLPSEKFADEMINNEVITETASLPMTPIIDGDLLPASIHDLRQQVDVKRTIIGVCEYEALLFGNLDSSYRYLCC